MDTETLIHHEGSISPSLPHIFSTIKSEPTDFWNPQTPPAVAESYSTYTPLENLHTMESPYSSYLTVVNGVPTYGSYPSLCSSYPNNAMPEDSDVPAIHNGLYRNSDLMFFPRDEGIGSSPSSLNSASPPSITNDSAGPICSTSNAHHYYETQQERSSPGDSAYSEELSLPRLIVHPQCVKCGVSSSDIWWRDGTGHFLCGSCYQGRSPPVVQPQDDEYEVHDRKRKRPSTLNKKDNQSCTNCEAVSTSLWRRNLAGEVVCNACGLYEKLHKCARPISMKKDTIQTRKRKPRGSGSKKKISDSNSNLPVKKDIPVISSSSYSLPTYSSLHIKESMSNLQPINDSVLLPPISSAASYYANYKPEINNPYHLMTSSVINMPLEPSNMSPSSTANT